MIVSNEILMFYSIPGNSKQSFLIEWDTIGAEVKAGSLNHTMLRTAYCEDAVNVTLHIWRLVGSNSKSPGMDPD